MVAGHRRFALTRHRPEGGLDTGFGDGGVVVTQVGNSDNASVTDVLVLGDGKLLAVGAARQDNEPRIALVRYTADGELDPGFGDGGRLIEPLMADGAVPADAALTDDGDVLITGSIRDGAGTRALLLRAERRRHARGRVRLGRRRLLRARDDGLRGRQPRVPAPGRVGRGDRFGVRAPPPAPRRAPVYILRVGANGARDAGFGANGMATAQIDGVRLATGVVDHAGRFVLLGGSTEGDFGLPSTAIARFGADGTLDAGFGGGDGWTEISDGYIEDALDADELPDGRLWISAYASVGSAPILGAWGSALLEADGTPVTGYGFDDNGTVHDQIGSGQINGTEQVGAAAVDGDTLVQVGTAAQTVSGGFLGETTSFGVRRYTLEGRAAPGFSGYFASSTSVGATTSTSLHRVRPQAGGGLLVAGSAVEGFAGQATIWKIKADGSPDAGWSGDGEAVDAVGDIGSHADDAQPGAGSAAGKVYVAGQAGDDDFYDTMLVTRHTASGGLDTAFSGDGVVLVRLRPQSGDGTAPACGASPPLCRDDDGVRGDGGEGHLLLPLADGGVLVIGTAGEEDFIRGGASYTRLVLARFAADGTPVTGFGTDGIVQIYRSGGCDRVSRWPARCGPAGRSASRRSSATPPGAGRSASCSSTSRPARSTQGSPVTASPRPRRRVTRSLNTGRFTSGEDLAVRGNSDASR